MTGTGRACPRRDLAGTGPPATAKSDAAAGGQGERDPPTRRARAGGEWRLCAQIPTKSGAGNDSPSAAEASTVLWAPRHHARLCPLLSCEIWFVTTAPLSLHRTVGRLLVFGVITACTACGGNTPSGGQPTAPSQLPVQTMITVDGSITDTLTGAPVGAFSGSTQSFPYLARVDAPGYLSRDVYVTSSTPTVDLIPESALTYYRNLVRDGFDHPESVQSKVLRRWSTSPSVYIRTVDDAGKRVDGANLDVVLQAMGVIEEVSGGQLTLASYEMGTESREGVRGWITVKWGQPSDDRCGTAQIGVSGGWIELNPGPRCTCSTGAGVVPRTVRHEFAHALGFFHTGERNDLLSGLPWSCTDRNATLSVRERAHLAIAFKRAPGNRDIDADPRPSSALAVTGGSSSIIVVD